MSHIKFVSAGPEQVMEKALEEIEEELSDSSDSDQDRDEREMGRGLRKKRPRVISSDEEPTQMGQPSIKVQ